MKPSNVRSRPIPACAERRGLGASAPRPWGVLKAANIASLPFPRLCKKRKTQVLERLDRGTCRSTRRSNLPAYSREKTQVLQHLGHGVYWKVRKSRRHTSPLIQEQNPGAGAPGPWGVPEVVEVASFPSSRGCRKRTRKCFSTWAPGRTGGHGIRVVSASQLVQERKPKCFSTWAPGVLEDTEFASFAPPSVCRRGNPGASAPGPWKMNA